jgi:pimeloyl-ACP methyl ester carboxylesterase
MQLAPRAVGGAGSSQTPCSTGVAANTLVPITFAPHVAEALPDARHLELDCGHVPQVEVPRHTHDAVSAFFAKTRDGRSR